MSHGAAQSQVGQRARARRAARLDDQQPSGRPDGVAGQSLPTLKVHAKAIQALSRADGRWYFLPVVELPVILTPGEDGYIVAECPRRPDFSGFPITR